MKNKIIRVCFEGCASVGKTTLAKALSKKLNIRYIKEFCEHTTKNSFRKIGDTRRFKKIPFNESLIIDRSRLSRTVHNFRGLEVGQITFGRNRKKELEKINNDLKNYTHLIYIPVIKEIALREKDLIRVGNEKRESMNYNYRVMLKTLKIKYYSLKTISNKDRLNEVLNIINNENIKTSRRLCVGDSFRFKDRKANTRHDWSK